MIEKILIANRGEIALRVMRACRTLHLKSVAIYSAVDRGELHVRQADEAVLIEGETPLATYLDQEKIIAAAKQVGAQAIHPGYGFLAENAYFSEAVEKAGLIFIGPTAHAITLMGDKVQARATMKEAGVPIIPGTDGAVTADIALEKAQEIGFPIMLKAQGGGGGKGIRVVTEESQLLDSLARASSEAEAAFANGSVYIEKLITKARHVEVQIMGDGRGRCIAIGERDCSLQRRNQKMVEEAPCCFITEETRKALHAAAARAGEAVKYRGAGTVECLVDPDQNFYFLEMNTRLQVEHAVTEMVYGIDLVEMQIDIARGKLDLPKPEELHPRGHSIEVRIIAENPYAGFMPSLGTVSSLALPGGPGVRLDSCLYEGMEITPYYDSMVAKLVVEAKDRPTAIQRTLGALEEFHLGGLVTNIPYAMELLRDKRVQNGETIHTKFMEDEFEAPGGDDFELAALAGAVARYLETPPPNNDDANGPKINPWKISGRLAQMKGKL